MSSYHAILLIVLLSAQGACSPAKPAEPQPAGITSRAFVGDAELEVTYRYQPQVGKEITFFVDAAAKTGSAGAVRLSLTLDGFTLVRGEPQWDATVNPGNENHHQVVLRAVDPVAKITIVTHHIARDTQLASDDIRFYLNEDGHLAECDSEVPACK